MRVLVRGARLLQRSQLSVQALTRFCSVYVFLLASWTDTAHLPLVALQGALLAIPYTLLEALIGRPLSADLVPERWHVEAWARTASVATVLPVGAIAYLSATVALPQTGPFDRLLMLAPVVVQLPLEAAFWATARTRSRQRANLIPQLTAVGTVLGGAAFAALDVRLDIAALPAQLAVLCWVLWRRTPAGPGQVRPGMWPSVKVGSVYCFAAAVDLSYAVALPSVAGAIAGQGAVVVLRAMDLAFGPFHIALSASVREDIVAGRQSRWRTGTRAMTVASLLVVSAVVIGSARLRGLLADDLATLGVAAVATYCAYKGLLMMSMWLSIRHMVWAAPRRYLVSAVGSRLIAFAGLAVSVWWARRVPELFVQLLLGEAAVVCWFLYRMRPSGSPPADADRRTLDEAVHQPGDRGDDQDVGRHQGESVVQAGEQPQGVVHGRVEQVDGVADRA
jgi:hypothetical protein